VPGQGQLPPRPRGAGPRHGPTRPPLRPARQPRRREGGRDRHGPAQPREGLQQRRGGDGPQAAPCGRQARGRRRLRRRAAGPGRPSDGARPAALDVPQSPPAAGSAPFAAAMPRTMPGERGGLRRTTGQTPSHCRRRHTRPGCAAIGREAGLLLLGEVGDGEGRVVGGVVTRRVAKLRTPTRCLPARQPCRGRHGRAHGALREARVLQVRHRHNKRQKCPMDCQVGTGLP